MKVIAVARFTLLRLHRTRYTYAAVMLVALVTALLWISDNPPNNDLNFAHNLARVFTWLAAIWLGVSLVHADREDGTLRSTLTRPVSLVEVLLGKVLGGAAYLALLSLAFTVCLNLAGLYIGASVSFWAWCYQLHLLPVHVTVMALALLLAQVMPRFAAGMIMTLAWIYSFISPTVGRLSAGFSPLVADIYNGAAKTLYLAFPPVSSFYLSFGDYVRLDLPGEVYLLLLAYALHYAVACCLLAAWALNRQEL